MRLFQPEVRNSGRYQRSLSRTKCGVRRSLTRRPGTTNSSRRLNSLAKNDAASRTTKPRLFSSRARTRPAGSSRMGRAACGPITRILDGFIRRGQQDHGESLAALPVLPRPAQFGLAESAGGPHEVICRGLPDRGRGAGRGCPRAPRSEGGLEFCRYRRCRRSIP